MPTEAPPDPPKITKLDRATFKSRVKRELAAQGMSGRALEKKIGMATGTLSKLFSGRLALTLRVLKEIAIALGVGPDVLVANSGLACLLTSAPNSPESAELLEARREIDNLRSQRAAAEATARALREETVALRRELAAARDAEAVTKAAADDAYAELTRARAGASTAMTLHGDAERARTEALQDATALRTAFAAETARCAEIASVADGWRKYAMERKQRVHYLEAELAAARGKAATASSAEAGKLLLACLASLGIGMVIADSSSS